MKLYLNNLVVKIVKELGINELSKSKTPLTWVQVEYMDGPVKGCRVPCIKEKLKTEKKVLDI